MDHSRFKPTWCEYLVCLEFIFVVLVIGGPIWTESYWEAHWFALVRLFGLSWVVLRLLDLMAGGPARRHRRADST